MFAKTNILFVFLLLTGAEKNTQSNVQFVKLKCFRMQYLLFYYEVIINSIHIDWRYKFVPWYNRYYG